MVGLDEYKASPTELVLSYLLYFSITYFFIYNLSTLWLRVGWYIVLPPGLIPAAVEPLLSDGNDEMRD